MPLDQLPETPVRVRKRLEKEIDAQQVWQAVNQLSLNEREAILCKYGKEMSIQEIAVVLNKSENAVKLLLSRGRKKLAGIKNVQEIRALRNVKKK